jgi:hypothetical protein
VAQRTVERIDGGTKTSLALQDLADTEPGPGEPELVMAALEDRQHLLGHRERGGELRTGRLEIGELQPCVRDHGRVAQAPRHLVALLQHLQARAHVTAGDPRLGEVFHARRLGRHVLGEQRVSPFQQAHRAPHVAPA